jgi:uncharacterized membrane protein YqjE
MARPNTEIEASAPMGIMEALRCFLGTWVAVLKTRVELIGTELEEQREWLERLVILSVAALFCLSFGVVFLTLFITMLFWAEYRQYVLGAFAGLYLAAGLWALFAARKKARNKPRMFSTTVSELEKDGEELMGRVARENT